MRAFGLNFPNPVGIAAGFDKNAQVPDALLRLGFGFVEVGTVTPLPQAGNPRPRLFRLEADEGVINRLGFNNAGRGGGARAAWPRAPARAASSASISAPTATAPTAAGDYVRLIEAFAPVASYFTVNVSSPNTPGLRDLQQAKALDELLARVLDARERVRRAPGRRRCCSRSRPISTLSDLDDVVGIARKRRVDGMIVGNTTIARPARCASATRRGSRAGCPAGRCSSLRRACWRRPSCAPRARSR